MNIEHTSHVYNTYTYICIHDNKYIITVIFGSAVPLSVWRPSRRPKPPTSIHKVCAYSHTWLLLKRTDSSGLSRSIILYCWHRSVGRSTIRVLCRCRSQHIYTRKNGREREKRYEEIRYANFIHAWNKYFIIIIIAIIMLHTTYVRRSIHIYLESI